MRTPNTVYGMLISFFLGICSVVLYADHQVSLSQSEVEQHRQAFLKNPHDGKSIRALAHYYYTHGEYAQAIPFYEKYKTLMPNEIEIHMKLGHAIKTFLSLVKRKKNIDMY